MTQTGSTAWIVIGWVALAVAFACALAIASDVARGYRQHMAIMNLVWPITALLVLLPARPADDAALRASAARTSRRGSQLGEVAVLLPSPVCR